MIQRRQQVKRCGLLLALLCLAATAAPACEPEKPRKVSVSVMIIYASEKDDTTDSKLSRIAREARKMYPKFKGFRMGDMSIKSLEVGKANKFALVDGQNVCVTIERAAGKMDRVQLKVCPPSMGKITYSTPCGKFFPFLTPIVTENGESIMVAIRVQPCKGK